MSRGKKKPKIPLDDFPAQEEWHEFDIDMTVVPSSELNSLMSTYRDGVLPTPVLLWRTEGQTVAAWELSEADFKAVSKLIGLDNG